MKVEIACPKCEWKPDGGAYWQCSCGNVWNTFDTAGRCPNCPKHHGGCGKWSKHLDWYRNLDTQLKKEVENALDKQPITNRELVKIKNTPIK